MVKSSIFLRIILNFGFFPPSGERERNPLPWRPGIGAEARPSPGLVWPGRRGLCASAQEEPGLGHFLHDFPRRGRAAPGKGERLLSPAGPARGAARPSPSLVWPGRRGVCASAQEDRAWAIFSTAFTPKAKGCSGQGARGGPALLPVYSGRGGGDYAGQSKRDRAWAIFSTAFTPKGQGCSGERGGPALSGRARQGRGPPFSQSILARAAWGYARQPKRDRAWAIFSMTFTPKGQRLSQPPQAMQSAAVAGRAW